MLTFYLSLLDTDEQKSKFSTIYTTYNGLMYHEAYRLAKNHHTAEDIMHDACLHIIDKIDIIRTEKSNELASVIVLITRHKALDTLRRLGRIVVSDDESLFDDVAADNTEETVLSADAYDRLYEVVEGLNDTYRIPLKMKAEGYKSTEIAQLLSLTEEAVRQRLFRGRKILREKLSQGL